MAHGLAVMVRRDPPILTEMSGQYLHLTAAHRLANERVGRHLPDDWFLEKR